MCAVVKFVRQNGCGTCYKFLATPWVTYYKAIWSLDQRLFVTAIAFRQLNLQNSIKQWIVNITELI